MPIDRCIHGRIITKLERMTNLLKENHTSIRSIADNSRVHNLMFHDATTEISRIVSDFDLWVTRFSSLMPHSEIYDQSDLTIETRSLNHCITKLLGSSTLNDYLINCENALEIVTKCASCLDILEVSGIYTDRIHIGKAYIYQITSRLIKLRQSVQQAKIDCIL